jgi:hypothetical protein
MYSYEQQGDSMNAILKQIAVATSLCIAAASSIAQATIDTAQRGTHRVKKLDTNKDKLISREEAKGYPPLAQHFDKIDVNKDGQLSRDEMKSARLDHKADQDGDGNISRAEADKKPHLAKQFDQIDTNKDGLLTPAERKAWMASHSGRGKK